jgi:hypothetical protein
MRKASSRWIALVIALVAVFTMGRSAHAEPWYDYHWKATGTPTSLTVVSSASKTWSPYVAAAAAAWEKSGSVDLAIVAGPADPESRLACDLIPGTIHVCSARYGNNGWLGWTNVTVAPDGEITAARVRINQSYFDKGQFDNRASRRHTACHELGHSIGLAHSTGTSCMNRTNPADPSRSWPGIEDLADLGAIYSVPDLPL